MEKEIVKVGMLGMGTVGGGVAELLKRNSRQIEEKTETEFSLVKILVRDPSKQRSVDLEDYMLTSDPDDIIEDPSISVVIEVIGGIEPAREYISRALQNGKYVITANKDLMATHGEELLKVARENKRNIFYEGSVGGGIPIIRPLRHSLVADQVKRIVGIVNGTTNYILTKMVEDDISFEEALSRARELGFAEADPSNDIEGLDASYKLIIMSGLAFGCNIDPSQVYVEGIGAVTREDIAYAREIGYVIKLVAIGEMLPEGLALRVHPTLVSAEHPLASVSNEFNAIFVEGDAVGEVMFYGRGAGALPTASAVLADMAEALRCIRRQAVNGFIEIAKKEIPLLPINRLDSRFYLRFLADDRPGVFAALANAFGDEDVSLDMVIQKRRVNSTAEIVLVTHMVEEDAFNRALEKVVSLPAIRPNPSKFRLLG
ncbi:MAG: homoserine dehydrogenase [Bacillota bacterium]|nr:homoserine dehydrogenase [Bacillota bacterium]